MSMVLCDSCGKLVDSDDDPEGFYIIPDKFICEFCRDMEAEAERFFAFEFEVWQGDMLVSSASGTRDDALREAMHYAAQYQQDGQVRVFEVTRTLVRPNAELSGPRPLAAEGSRSNDVLGTDSTNERG